MSLYDLRITPYYLSAAKHDADLAYLKVCAHAAYDGVDLYPGPTQAFLRDWARHCKLSEISGDGAFSLVFIGQLFLEAYLKLEKSNTLDSYTKGLFQPWVEAVFKRCARRFIDEHNNRGSWGILGMVLADLVTGHDPADYWGRIAQHCKDNWNGSGEMRLEVKRTNSGLWYSYFSLAPLLRACQLSKYPAIGDLKRPLYWLWGFCRCNSEMLKQIWPHKLPWGPFGWVWRKLYPCADELELPRRNDWPANLFAAAGHQFGYEPWRNYPVYPINDGVHIFRDWRTQ